MNHKLTLLLSVIIGALFLFYLQSILLLVFLGIIFALVLNLPTAYLQSKGVPRNLALGITFLGGLLFDVAVLLIVIPALYSGVLSLTAVLPEMLNQISSTYASLQTTYSFLPNLYSLIPSGTEPGNIQAVTETIIASLSDVGGILLDTLIVLLIAIFLLINPNEYKQVFLTLIPFAYKQKTENVLLKIKHTLESWIKTLGLSISVTFFLVWIALSLLGFPNAFVIAIIAGIATFIPNIGAILPIIPIFIFGITDGGLVLTLWAAVIYITIQVTEGNVITPTFMKANLNILPAGILVFQIIAAQILGVLGVLLAVPILVVIMVLVQEFYIAPMSRKNPVNQ